MLIAPAESNLQGRVKLRQRRSFGDEEPPSHGRRYAAQPGTELHRTHFVLGVHRPDANTNVGPAQTAIQHPEWTTLRYGEQVMAARGGMARAAKESGGIRDKRMMDFTKLQKGPARKYGNYMR